MTKDVNEYFFNKIDSEIKAYLLGFYLGDGSISAKRLRVSVNKKDEYIVNLFKKFISPNTKITYRKDPRVGYENSGVMATFCVQRKQLYEDLDGFGFGLNKTYTKKRLPVLSDELFLDFLRGYFDADGSINVSIATRKTGRQAGYKTLLRNFQITSKDRTILDDIQKEVLNRFGINLSVGTYKKASIIYTCKLSVIKQLNVLLYNKANYFFKRKKDSFEFTMKTSREIRQLKGV